MDNFLHYIFDFVYSIFVKLNTYIGSYQADYFQWLTKNVFTENSLIGLNITYRELVLYVSTWFLVAFFIILFVKYFLKLLGLFRLD